MFFVYINKIIIAKLFLFVNRQILLASFFNLIFNLIQDFRHQSPNTSRPDHWTYTQNNEQNR